MTEPERTGGKPTTVDVTPQEAVEIIQSGIGAPRLYIFADAKELREWRAARKPDQAGDAHAD